MKLSIFSLWLAGLFALASIGRAQTATLTSSMTNLSASGGQLVLTATTSYAGLTPTAIGWTITLPTGWAIVGVAGDTPSFAPAAGTTGSADFAYVSFPANSATFTVTVSYPATSDSATVNAVCSYRSPLKNITLPNLSYGIVSVAPTIAPLANNSAAAGAATTFTATVAGTAPLTYQWRKNGTAISGATSSTYTLPQVLVSDLGNYSVVATNAIGTATSNNAALTMAVSTETGTVPAGFGAAGYLALYPDAAAVFGTNYYQAWLYYRNYGIYQGEVYDELFRVEEYLTLYPDLFAIFGTNLSGYLDHWLSTGRLEGKLGRIPLEFSAAGYFARNPDVATAVGNNALLAWSHYWLYGIYEGRAYDDELRVFEYLAINADLTAAFKDDWRTAALHWMRYGRTEGRLGRIPPIFSVSYYLARYPEIGASWGTYPTTVFLHFWLYGVQEARLFDTEFLVDDYLALNPDLAAAFGTNRQGAFKHWVRYGRSEGRAGKR